MFLFTRSVGEELDRQKIDFFDEDFLIISNKDGEKLKKKYKKMDFFVRSRRFFTADGIIYLTKDHWYANISPSYNSDGYIELEKNDVAFNHLKNIIIKTHE